jgi:hypothetical protein
MSQTLINFQISDILSESNTAPSVLVPNRGWVIFGGNKLPTSQILQTLSGNWTKGPNMYDARNVYGNCGVQVNQT